MDFSYANGPLRRCGKKRDWMGLGRGSRVMEVFCIRNHLENKRTKVQTVLFGYVFLYLEVHPR